jgi:hypothetical protein
MQPLASLIASHLVKGGQYAQDNAMYFNLFGGRHHGGAVLELASNGIGAALPGRRGLG